MTNSLSHILSTAAAANAAGARMRRHSNPFATRVATVNPSLTVMCLR
ncbi:MAG: hypothetical protein M3065_11345 [Actinomycetota bacterium]|nr:hypothetical protein [Actinomycetota bacterium]